MTVPDVVDSIATLSLTGIERFSAEERARIDDALAYAIEKHAPQRRISGEPYIIHPVAVTQLCIDELAADADVVVAALLHDTVEDCGVTLDEIESRFGPRVRYIVDACTNVGEGDGEPKIHDWYVRTNKSHKKLRRMGAQDNGAYLIKIADRWHNLTTCAAMRPYNQERLAQDALSFTVPLCRELGLDDVAARIAALCEDVLARVRG
jgi:GTP pyrophosphokinase